ncbi:MAG: hypothetical protein NC120_06070 [Ruminococcus sp.]|nr:hypothetical protein [Ruminococcus sp.]
MSNVIDKRVVEMRFDNGQFERGVSTSISSIEKLKGSMNFDGAEKSFKSIEKAAAKADISPLEKGIEAVTVKFSTLEVAAVTAIANITNSAVDAGKQLVKSLTIDQVTEGFGKYEQKTAAVQTIMNATGKSVEQVTASLAKLNWFTDETSYNFVDMVDNIGKFTSAGVDLDIAVTAMEGIADLAAVSGQGINEASRAMYNFAQAIGVGSVKLIDWKSIENANMATQEFKENIIETALACGTLTKGTDGVIKTLEGNAVSIVDFNSALKDEWFTSDVLLKTLGKYGEYADEVYKVSTREGILCAEAMEKVSGESMELGEKAFKAAQEAKTLTDAINAAKDAVSTGWMTSFEIVIGDYVKAKEVWTEFAEVLYDVFAASGEVRNALLTDAMESGWDKLVKKIGEAGISAEQFQNEISETAKANGKNVDEIMKMADSFEDAVKKQLFSGDDIRMTFERLASSVSEAANVTEDVSEKFKSLDDISNKVLTGNFGNGAERMKKLTNLGYDYAEVQDIVNRKLKGETFILEDLSDAQLKSMGYSEEQAAVFREMAKEARESGSDINELLNSLERPSGRELLIDSFRNAIEGLTGILDTVKEAWSEVFPPVTAETLYTILERVHYLSEKLVLTDETADKLKRTFKGVFSVFRLIGITVKTVLNTALEGLSKLIGKTDIDILELLASAGDLLTKFTDWAVQNDSVAKGIGYLVNRFEDGAAAISEWAGSLDVFGSINNAVSAAGNGISTFTDSAETGISKASEALTALRKNISSLGSESVSSEDGSAFAELREESEECKKEVTGNISFITSGIEKFVEPIKKAFEKIIGFFTNAKTHITGFLSYFAENIKASTLIAAGISALLIGLGAELYQILKVVENISSNITKPATSFAGVMKSISKAINMKAKADAFDSFMVGLRHLAEGVLILAGALALISNIDSNKLQLSVTTLTTVSTIMVTMAVLVGVIAKLAEKSGEANIAALNILGLTVGLSVLVLALRGFEKLDSAAIFKNMGALTILLAVFSAATIAISKFAPELSKNSGFLIALAAAVGVLVLALRGLAAVDPGAFEGKIGILAAAVGGLVLLAAACKNVNFGAAGTLIAAVVSIGLLLSMVDKINAYKPGELKKALVSFAGILTMFAGLMLASSKAGEHAGEAGKSILAMSEAILLLCAVVKIIGDTDGETLAKAGAAIGVLFGIFTGIMVLTKRCGRYAANVGKMLLLMSGAIVVLAGVITMLSLLDPKTLVVPTVCVSTLMALMALIVYASRYATRAKKSMLVIGAVILGLSAVLALLTLLDTQKLIGAAAALSSAMLALSGSLVLIGKAQAPALAGLKALIPMGAVVLGVSVLISELSKCDPLGLISASGALAVAMLAFAGMMAIMSIAGAGAAAAVPALIPMTIAAAGLAACVGLLSMAEPINLLAASAALSVAMLAFAGAMAICTLVGATATTALPAIGIVAAVIAALAAVCGIIGALCSDGVFDAVIKGVDMLGELLSGLGYALGSFIGGAVQGVKTGGVDKMVEDMNKITQSLSGLTADDLNAIELVSSIGNAIADMKSRFGAISKKDVFSNCLDGIEIFASDLIALGMILSGRRPDISNIPIDEFIPHIAKAADAGKAIGEINTDSVSRFAQVEEWREVKQGITLFAMSLMNFGREVEEISKYEESVLSAVHIGEMLAELQNAFPNTGGLLAGLIGDNDWGTISIGLASFGMSLMRFGEEVDGIGAYGDDIAAAVRSGQSLAELQNLFPNSGGALAWLIGDNDWVSLADGLAEFGRAMRNFAVYSTTVAQSADDVEFAVGLLRKVASVLTVVSDINNSSEGYTQLWTTLLDGLDNVGAKLVEFSDTVKDLNVSDDRLNGIFEALHKAAFTLNSIAGLGINSEKLTENLICIGSVGTYLRDFSIRTENLDKNKFSVVVTRLNDLLTFIKDANGLDISGIENFKEGLVQIADTGIDSFTGKFDDSYAQIDAAASGMINRVVAKLNGKRTDLIQSGRYAAEGFVLGLTGDIAAVTAAGTLIGNTLLKSVDETLGIHSPALEMILRGMFVDAGLVEGTEEGAGDVAAAGENLGNILTGGFDSALESGIDWVKGKLGSTVDFNGIISKIMPDSSSLTSMLEESGFGGISDWVNNMFGGNSEKITEIQADIEKVNAQIENATKKYGAESAQVQELKNKLSDLNDELSKYTLFSGFDVNGIFESINANGLDSLSGILTDEMTAALSPNELKELNDVVDDARSKQLKKAEEDYDGLLEDYKTGKVTQAEYDERYLELLKKNTAAQIDLVKYANEQMAEHIKERMDEIQSAYEDKMEDIGDKIKKFADDNKTTYTASLTFTTNKSKYEEGAEEYETKIRALNRQLEESEKKYGENSFIAKNYRKQLEKLNEEYDKYKSDYEKKVDSGLNEDEIIGVKFNDELDKNNALLTKYRNELKKLTARENIPNELLAEIAQMDKQEAIAVMKYLNGLDDAALSEIIKKREKEDALSKEIAGMLYGQAAKDAADEYVNDMLGVINTLPDSAKNIGYYMALGLAQGLSDGTKETLDMVGQTCDAITNEIKKRYEIHSPSELFKREIGKNLAAGLSGGFCEAMASASKDMVNAVPSDFSIAADNIFQNGERAAKNMAKTISAISTSVVDGINSNPIVRPTIDLSRYNKTARSVNAAFSKNLVYTVDGSINGTVKSGSSQAEGGASSDSFTFNQYITTPDPVSPRDVKRYTRRGLQLAAVKY